MMVGVDGGVLVGAEKGVANRAPECVSMSVAGAVTDGNGFAVGGAAAEHATTARDAIVRKAR
jgi:hypothetical protein